MQSNYLEVLFTPADFGLLAKRDLRGSVCVVFDVLRATSSMITALANSAGAILPVAEISEAVALRTRDPQILLAGERDGLKIEANLTGSIGFDLGNSPREFTPETVRGRKIAMTTTNGTRALRACLGADKILIASFLNLRATAEFLRAQQLKQLILVCSGTFEEAALEDVLCAGGLLQALGKELEKYRTADSVSIARIIYEKTKGNILGAISNSRNGRRLLSRPELKEDVAWCAQRDIFNLVATMDSTGCITKATA
jgi:2-phosphosulfolactate phosphatase